LVLSCAGCSTKYQDLGFAGGVAAQQMSAFTYRIVARGNSYTSPTVIQDYTLLKAAETTKKAGGTHFMIISASDASTAGTISAPGQMQTSVYGNTAYSTYTPGSTTVFVKPGQDTYIQVITVASGQAPPEGANSADEIIQFIGSRIQKG
jgi:hypothetical protein